MQPPLPGGFSLALAIVEIYCPPGSSIRRVYNQKYLLLRATDGLSHGLLNLRNPAFANRSRRLVQVEGRDGRSSTSFLSCQPCCLRVIILVPVYRYTIKKHGLNVIFELSETGILENNAWKWISTNCLVSWLTITSRLQFNNSTHISFIQSIEQYNVGNTYKHCPGC